MQKPVIKVHFRPRNSDRDKMECPCLEGSSAQPPLKAHTKRKNDRFYRPKTNGLEGLAGPHLVSCVEGEGRGGRRSPEGGGFGTPGPFFYPSSSPAEVHPLLFGKSNRFAEIFATEEGRTCL